MGDLQGERGPRIDKWLWAARFYKTRALAVKAVEGGKVHLNGARVKPSRIVREGDDLIITRGLDVMAVRVRGLDHRRRPAVEARLLYEESAESIAARERAAEERRLLDSSLPPHRQPGRPDKHQRSLVRRFRGKG